MKTISMLLMSATLGLLMQTAAADQVYRWVDKDGHVHYSQTPPATTGVNAQTLNIAPPPPDPTSLQNEHNLAQDLQKKNDQSQADQQKAQAAQQQKDQDKQRCDGLRQRLQLLQQSGRVASIDGQGNKSYISDDDKAKQIQDLENTIAKDCGGGNH